MERLAREKLPAGFGFEWTGLAFQEKAAGGYPGLIFGLALVFVFLVLAALYESWAIPFGVLLGLPVGIFGAFLGTYLRGLDNGVYVQIGLVMLLGLAAKNAILIVEFARMKRDREKLSIGDAALEGARLRFRPILMTSFAFILGVVPLMIPSGPVQPHDTLSGPQSSAECLLQPCWDCSSCRSCTLRWSGWWIGCAVWRRLPQMRSARRQYCDPDGRDRSLRSSGPGRLRQPTIPPPERPRSSAVPRTACRAQWVRGGESWNPPMGGPDSRQELSNLIQEALANNYDAQIAAARVLEAGAQFTVSHSAVFPSLDAQGGYNNLRTAENGSSHLPAGVSPYSDYSQLSAGMSWELDLWGRVRNANAASRAALLASEEARRAVRQSLVSEVASAYFLLLDLDRNARSLAARSRFARTLWNSCDFGSNTATLPKWISDRRKCW